MSIADCRFNALPIRIAIVSFNAESAVGNRQSSIYSHSQESKEKPK